MKEQNLNLKSKTLAELTQFYHIFTAEKFAETEQRHTNRTPNLGQTTRLYINQQKKRTFRIMDFAVPADHRVKLKESEKKEKYLDLT